MREGGLDWANSGKAYDECAYENINVKNVVC
jgi:hypothetical protein